MAKPLWKVDEFLTIQLKRTFFGGYKVMLNDSPVKVKAIKGRVFPFTLENGKKGEIKVAMGLASANYELRIDGELILSEEQTKKMSCLCCGSPLKPGEKFCEKCGAEAPSTEVQMKIIKVHGARKTMAYLAGIFFFSGVVFFFIQSDTAEKSMKTLATYQDSDIYPTEIDGKKMTVGELKADVQREPYVILVTNFILAAFMLVLYQYAKKSPLVALLIATGIYVSVVVLNAILSPITLAQGLVMKIIVIGLLINGIRSALELRKEAR